MRGKFVSPTFFATRVAVKESEDAECIACLATLHIETQARNSINL